MAREWALAGVPEDELLPPPPPTQPQTPKGKWENFWYHYKWVVFGVAAGLIVLTVLIVQMATRDEPDYFIPLVTNEPMNAQQISTLETALTPYAKDLDGDGKVEVQIENWYLNPKNNAALAQSVYANSQNLTVHLAAGDRLFFLFEDSTYRDRIYNLLSEGTQFFTPLDLPADSLAENGTCYDWYGTTLQRSDAMKGLPEHLYFGVRSATGTAEKKQEAYQQSMDLLTTFAAAQSKAAAENG